MEIGSLKLSSNLFLAPMAGYTNLPFRLTIRELGGVGLCTTELINARSMLEKNKKALKLLETNDLDRPLSIQLFGSVPGEMRDAALLAENSGVTAVDINMGCPVRKVCGVGAGAAMMQQLKKTAELAGVMVKALKIPVTAKMRLGWDENNITAPDLAQALEDVGVKAVFVHGRTRAQGFGGKVNLSGIRSVVQAVKSIPVIGNGDITTPQAAKHMMDETGCAGVSIGRGAFYNPWLFLQTQQFLKTGNLACEPAFEERLRVMRIHLERMIGIFGEAHGCRMFRKVAPWYVKRVGPASEFIRRVATLASLDHFNEILGHYRAWRRQFLDEHGELKLRFRPPPLAPSFMDAEELPLKARIPVPQGPNEWW